MQRTSAPLCRLLVIAIAMNASTQAFAPTRFTSFSREPAWHNTRVHGDMGTLHQSSRAMDGAMSELRNPILDPEDTSIQEQPSFSMDRVGLSPNLPPATVNTYANPRQFTLFQQFARISPMAAMGAYSMKPEPFDTAVETVWSWIYNWDIAHTGLFEAHVASFSFVIFIAAWSVAHIILGEEKTKQYALDGKVPHEDPLAWTRMTWEGVQLWFNPLVSYLVSIWIYQQVFHTHQPLPALAPSFGVLVCEVVFGVFLYDLVFFPIHYAMHKSPLKIVRGFHGYHHRHTNGALNSIETVQHSYIDGGLQVMTNILVQHISPFGGPKHMLSRIIHNIIVTYLLTESHSGYNLPWMSHNIWPEFIAGSPRHDRHHHDGRVYYQQFFMYLDDAMGLTDQSVQEQLKRKSKEFEQQRNKKPPTK